VQKMRAEQDPIDRVRQRLMDEFSVSEENMKSIDKSVKEIVTAAAEFAQQSPEPDPAELWTDILVGE